MKAPENDGAKTLVVTSLIEAYRALTQPKARRTVAINTEIEKAKSTLGCILAEYAYYPAHILHTNPWMQKDAMVLAEARPFLHPTTYRLVKVILSKNYRISGSKSFQRKTVLTIALMVNTVAT